MPLQRNDDAPISAQDDQDVHTPSQPDDDSELSSQRDEDSPIAAPADDAAPRSAEDDDELISAEDDDEPIAAHDEDLPVAALADDSLASSDDDDLTSSELDRDAPVRAHGDDPRAAGRSDAEVASAVAAAELSEAVPPQAGAVPPQIGWVPPQAGARSGNQPFAESLHPDPLPGEPLPDEPLAAESGLGEPLAGEPLRSAGSGRGRPPQAAPGAHARGGVDLGQQWHDIQAGFVDDPRLAVELAAQATAAALSALASDLQERQSALGQSGADDTEQLRSALQGYRDLCQDIEAAGRQLPQPSSAP
jgi:hypothetical protein